FVHKMDRAASKFNTILEGLALRLEAGEGGKQRRVNVQNTIRECSHKIRRQQAHIAGQADELDFVFVQHGDHLPVVRFAFQSLRRNGARGDAARFCAFKAGRAFAIADDDGDFRVGNLAGCDAVCERFEVRTAAAQQHAYALLHKQKTLTQPRASVKLGLHLGRAGAASCVTGQLHRKVWALALECPFAARKFILKAQTMTNRSNLFRRHFLTTVTGFFLALGFCAPVSFAQQSTPGAAKSAGATGSHDPAEPPQNAPHPKILPRPAGAIARTSIDEQAMRAIIREQVSCGTRLTLSSWTDPKRGIGCGRDFIIPRFNEIAKASDGKLEIVVDKFESKSERTGPNPVHLENVYGILKGSDPNLAKNIFIVVGDFDSRPSNVMD